MKPREGQPYVEATFAPGDRVALKVFDGGPGEIVATCPIAEVGLPSAIRDAETEVVDPPPTIPDGLRAIAGRAPSTPIIWLRVSPAESRLPLLPWDRWLSEVLHRPVVRFGLDARRPRAARARVVVWASLPDDERRYALPQLCAQAVTGARALHGDDADVHVFTEADFGDAVAAQLGPRDARVHRLGDEPPRRDGLRSVWLRWIAAEVDGPVDLFVAIAHGVYVQRSGVLAVTEHPAKVGPSELVGAPELKRALDGLGARALALVVVPGCYSRSGIFRLADTLSRARAGTVAVLDHEAWGGDLGATLAEALGPIARGDEPALVPLPHVRLHSSPDVFGHAAEAPEDLYQRVQQVAQRAVAPAPDDAAWKANEYVLQAAAQLRAEEGGGAAAKRGRAQAIEFLADLLAKHGGAS